MVIGGFRIEPGDDLDTVAVELAPAVADAGGSVLLYAIGVNNRLDPTLYWQEHRCDDAGRRGCTDVPSINGGGIRLNNGVSIEGDRFDAGALINTPGEVEYHVISFGGTTRGEYALVLYGQGKP
jgi:hypothetical protein